MNKNPTKASCVLGLVPSSRGVGFAVMITGNTLVDWGVKPVKSGNKNARSLSNVGNLIDHYKPDVIAIEDYLESRRGPRVQALTVEIIALAGNQKIRVKKYSRKQLNLGVFDGVQGTKHALAERLASQFPKELGFRLPRKRRPWTSEAYQMDIFEAVALAQASCGV
jgi:Holliday junction resolvasome RuvABC endonuclease subunit